MTKKTNLSSNSIGKASFIRLLATEAGFTLADTEAFWDAFMRLIVRSLIAGKTLNLTGFGKLYVKTIAPRKLYLGLLKEYGEVGESKRPTFKLSSTLKKVLKENTE